MPALDLHSNTHVCYPVARSVGGKIDLVQHRTRPASGRSLSELEPIRTVAAVAAVTAVAAGEVERLL